MYYHRRLDRFYRRILIYFFWSLLLWSWCWCISRVILTWKCRRHRLAYDCWNWRSSITSSYSLSSKFFRVNSRGFTDFDSDCYWMYPIGTSLCLCFHRFTLKSNGFPYCLGPCINEDENTIGFWLTWDQRKRMDTENIDYFIFSSVTLLRTSYCYHRRSAKNLLCSKCGKLNKKNVNTQREKESKRN